MAIQQHIAAHNRPEHVDAQPPRQPTVIPTEAGRRFFFFFAPAKKSAREVEGSLFIVLSFLPRVQSARELNQTRRSSREVADRSTLSF